MTHWRWRERTAGSRAPRHVRTWIIEEGPRPTRHEQVFDLRVGNASDAQVLVRVVRLALALRGGGEERRLLGCVARHLLGRLVRADGVRRARTTSDHGLERVREAGGEGALWE